MEYDGAIGTIEMIINALHSTTLGESPFMIENGVEFRLPILSGLQLDPTATIRGCFDDSELTEQTVQGYADARAKQWDNIFRTVVSRL